MHRLIFIGTDAGTAEAPGPACRPRLLRRVPLAISSLRIGLTPIRYRAPRRMLRAPVAGELPMRLGLLKPAPAILAGAQWSRWLLLGGIGSRPWAPIG